MLLSGLMQDDELMGLLGLQVEWESDMKRIDPDLDFKGFDPDELS
jgi:hypothetical protein